MEASDIVALKKEMRRSVLRRRDEITSAERTRRSVDICEKAYCAVCDALGSLREVTDSRVAVFSSFGSEVSLSHFEHLAERGGITLCYPAMLKDADTGRLFMEFFEVPRQIRVDRDADFLVHPARGFDRADLLDLGCIPVRVGEIDCALVPLVAFDDQGGRLGYGGGNYDAFLEGRRDGVRALGIAFLEQRVHTVPRESHDMPIDDVIAG